MGLQVRTGVIFVAEKRLQRLFYRVAAAFCIFGLHPPCRIAPTMQAANQLNIAYPLGMVSW